MPITLHSEESIEKMRVAGRLAAEVLDYITPHVKAGITTGELNRLCHDYMVDVQGAVPACLNYCHQAHATPFPKSVTTAVNEQVCHGIPGDRVLQDGDIINIDVTVIKDGFHGDTSRMFHVGETSPAARRLCEAAFECMWAGIARIRPGAHVGDISFAIQKQIEPTGYSLVRDFGGHGIGRTFHDEPFIAAHGEPGTLEQLLPGMIFTVEPIVNAGGCEIEIDDDGWTFFTADRSLSAQWEHTVLVTETGFEVLTMSAGCPPPHPARPDE